MTGMATIAQSMMTGYKIFERLSFSDRWGGNDQPSIFWITAILEQLPVEIVIADNDCLQIEFSRDLKPLEYWLLGSLLFDNIEHHKEDRMVNLWWD